MKIVKLGKTGAVLAVPTRQWLEVAAGKEA
jgi:hypothetical protein